LPIKRSIDSDSTLIQTIPEPKVNLSSNSVLNGSVFSVDVIVHESLVKESPDQSPEGMIGSNVLEFIPVSLGRWKAIVPIDFMQKAETLKITVSYPLLKTWSFQSEIKVLEGDYPKEYLKVAPKHVSPSPKDLKRIRAEQVILNRIYSEKTPTIFWTEKYQIPVDSSVTSPFGVKRIYNGELNGYHKGLDLRAPTGTPIYAPKRGKIVLTKDLFYTGNTVLIDHGWGIYTLYAHLSAISVKEGQIVEVGTQLGLSGSTGRSTGPHLHWGASIGSIKVNPLDLMKVLQ
jgi:murein DD-endopeptidase MepM/ murein hydrolase activator NlpD